MVEYTELIIAYYQFMLLVILINSDDYSSED